MSRDGLNTREFLSSSESVQLGSTGSPDALSIPSRINLYEAEFSRTGDDLIVQNDGQSLVVVDYFSADEPQDLRAWDDGVLRGEIVEILAGSAGDTRLAQTTPGEGPRPIGQVEVAEGSVRVQRTDGTVEQLGVGTKIYQHDVLISDADGNLSVTFADGTIFTLSASSRMVVDELIYDPEGSDNSGAFSLVQGGFVFVAGQVAKTGSMTVETPAATMGIRGTNVSAEVVTVAGDTEVQLGLNRDWDDTIGSIDVFVGGEYQGTIVTTDILWVISSATGTIQQIPRTLAEDAPEQDLIEEAYDAFLKAQGRVDQGENWVEQGTRSNSNRNSAPSDDGFNEPGENEQQEEESDPEDGDAPLEDGSFDDTNFNDGNIDNIRNPGGDPVANDVSVAGLEDASGSDPIGGSTNVNTGDGRVLSFAIESPPQNGTATINDQGEFTYIPAPNFSGTDSFVYSVSDGQGGFDQAVVTITVAPVNDNPVAADDPVQTGEEQPVTIDPLSNDVDIDGDTLVVTGYSQGASGTVVQNADGTLTYTPNENFNGSDSFTYVVEDGQGGSDSATVFLSVNATNDAPIALDDTVNAAEDSAITFDPRSNDGDADGDPVSITGTSSPTNGNVIINADGTLTYTPDPDFNGTDQFTYTVEDGQGGSDTATVTVNVGGVNDPPVASDDTISTDEDQAVTFDPRSGDSDPDGDVLTVTGTTTPANGSVVINADGTLTYTPDPDFSGSDSFTYTVEDGQGGSDTATVTVNVALVNDPPVAGDDSQVTDEDQPLTFDPRGNDTDADGDALLITGTTTPGNGSVVINVDGTLTYTPNANFSGSDSFAYTVEDGRGGSDTATVTITVNPVNDAPVATIDAVSTNEDQSVTFDPRTNDVDPEGDPLTITSTSTPANGSVVINADGTLTYTPDPNFNGTDSFTYTVEDGQGGSDTAEVSVFIGLVNDPPVAADDAETTLEDQAITFDPRGNDVDLDGDPLTITATSDPQNGSVVINGDGTLTYTPDANFNGTDSFTYTIEDGQGASDTATVVLTVTLVNDLPIAVDDPVSTNEDQAVTFDPRSNDSDADGDPLTVTGTTVPANGTVVINGDGTLTYTPDADFNGADSFTYTINDGQGGTDTATVNITVAPVNDAPDASDDPVNVNEDQSVTFDPRGNDSDVDGDPLTVTATSPPSNGSVVINANGTLTYTPDADFNGADSFTYTISDGEGGTDTATVNVTVAAVNDLPVAANDPVETTEDQSVTFDPRGNDSDIDGDPLTVTATSTPSNGVVTINGNGTLTYTPDADFNGQDSFTYTISDGQGGTDTATVNVTVLPGNDPPTAVDDEVNTNEDQAVTFDPRGNDSDIDGDPLTVTATSTPSNGVVTINGNGTLTYTPDANFSGNDSFTYTIEDGEGGSDTATVTIAVASVNDVPVANDDAATTDENQSVIIDPLANDNDIDGDLLTISSVSVPAHGMVVDNGNGTVTYTPDANFHGIDSFTYTIDDGQGGSDTATVTVTVNSVNDAPVASPDLLITQQGSSGSVNVVANDSDIDGDVLTVSGTTSPQNGSVSFSGGSVTYTPIGGFYGLDSFEYTVSDGQGGTDTETVTVVVEQDPSSLPPDFPVTISFDPSTPGNVPGTFDINITSVSTTNINLVFAMDSSGSITQEGWNQQVSAVSSALSNLASDFSGSQTNVDVYIINYATNVQTVGKFDLVNDTTNLLNAVNSLPFQNGGTNWESALDTANSFFGGEPSGEVNIMYFITDGNPVPTGQDWQGALSDLNSSVSVDIEAFAIGSNVNLGNLNIIDSDGSATSVTSTAALEAAFDQTPLFNAQMIDFSLRLNVDGADQGEIANINSPSLVQNGLNFELQLADIPGLQGQLGSVNVFSVTATFDLDGNLTTTGDQVELFSVGTLVTSQTAGISASSATGGAISNNGGDLIPMAQNLSGQDPSAPAAPDAQQLQGVMDFSANGGNLPTSGGAASESGASGGQGGALGSTGFGDAMGGLLGSLALEGGEANSMPSA